MEPKKSVPFTVYTIATKQEQPEGYETLPPILFCVYCGVSSDDRNIDECECGKAFCSAHYDIHHCDFR